MRGSPTSVPAASSKPAPRRGARAAARGFPPAAQRDAEREDAADRQQRREVPSAPFGEHLPREGVLVRDDGEVPVDRIVPVHPLPELERPRQEHRSLVRPGDAELAPVRDPRPGSVHEAILDGSAEHARELSGSRLLRDEHLPFPAGHPHRREVIGLALEGDGDRAGHGDRREEPAQGGVVPGFRETVEQPHQDVPSRMPCFLNVSFLKRGL